MGKKRDLANKNIEKLIDEYVDTLESCNRANCVSFVSVVGEYEKVECNHDCESCKEYFYIHQKEKLRDRFIVN